MSKSTEQRFDEKITYMEDAGFTIDFEIADTLKQFLLQEIKLAREEAREKERKLWETEMEGEPLFPHKIIQQTKDKTIKEIEEIVSSRLLRIKLRLDWGKKSQEIVEIIKEIDEKIKQYKDS